VKTAPYIAAVSLHDKGLTTSTTLRTEAMEVPRAPMEVVLEQSLLSHLRMNASLTNAAVLRVLMDEVHLMRHLAALRTFFFMTKGDVLHDFTANLFWRLEYRQHLGKAMDLNTQLHEALTSLEDYGCHNIRCDFDEEIEATIDAKDKYGIRALDALQLDYKTEWPLNLVISPAAITQYNKVFTLLLQIKRAQFLLNRIADTSKTTPLRGAHEFQLFQAELRHFVNNLHLYVMTRVLHSTWTEHKERIASAANIDELFATHTSYIEANLTRALLSSKGSENRVMQFIRSILGMVLEFTSVYRHYLELIGIKAERRALPEDAAPEPRDSDSEEVDGSGDSDDDRQAEVDAQCAERMAAMDAIRGRFKQQHRLLMMILQKKVEKGMQREMHLEDMLVRLNYNSYYD